MSTITFRDEQIIENLFKYLCTSINKYKQDIIWMDNKSMCIDETISSNEKTIQHLEEIVKNLEA
jgi:hypothetical protein